MTNVPEPSIFTRIINREIPGYIAYEDDKVAVLVALEGHLLVVPKDNYRDIYEIPEEIAAHIMKVAVKIARILPTITGCTGINLVQSNGTDAGQEVFHFHLHIKPRFSDDKVIFTWDTNTTPAETRAALSEAIIEKLT